MGISGFAKWLSKTYPKVKSTRKPGNIDTVLLDANGLFYDSVNKIFTKENIKKLQNQNAEKSYDLLIQDVIENLNTILKNYKPNKNFVLAIDGVANCGKMWQQKRRRFKKEEESSFFDRTLLTPGTTLMIKIDEAFEKWVKTLNIPLVIYSSHLDPGEAEHKIFDYIRNKELLTSYGETLLFGLDRDLIVLALLCSQKNMYIVQDDKNYRKKTIDYFSIDYLRLLLKKDLRFEGCDETLLIQDFAILVTFLGNDFLPTFPTSYDSNYIINEIFQLYKDLELHLTNHDNNIEWDNLKELFKGYHKLEIDHIFHHLYKNPRFFEYTEIKDSFSSLKNKSFETRENVKKAYSNFKELWYPKQFKPITNVLNKLTDVKEYYSEEDIDGMSENFLKMMQWYLHYYTKGYNSISNKLFYPYYYTPLPPDIINYLEKTDDLSRLTDVSNKHNVEYSCIHQLLLVLPPNSINGIPEAFRRYYEHMYPINPDNWIEIKEGESSCGARWPAPKCTKKEDCTHYHKQTKKIPPINLEMALDAVKIEIPDYLMNKPMLKLMNKKQFKENKKDFNGMNHKYSIDQDFLM